MERKMTYTPHITGMRQNIKSGLLSYVDGVNILMGHGMSLFRAMELLAGAK